MKIAVLSSYTIDSITYDKPSHEWYVSKYAQWQEDILNNNSALYKFNPDVVLVSLDAENFNWLFDNLNILADNFSCVFIHSFFCNHLNPLRFLPNQKQEDCYRKLDLYSLTSNFSNVEILDIDDIISECGSNTFDARYYYLAKMPFSNIAMQIMRNQLETAIQVKFGKRKKCLVLDLDDTLWGGILGDGVENLILADDGIGKAYFDFQKAILQLSKTGIILAICSKNDEKTALHAINNHPYMVLREKDIAAWKINWMPKYENIQQIANQLNIGIDSFVFLDDSQVERESIKSLLPEVLVPDFPSNSAEYVDFLCKLTCFETFNLTQEDQSRNGMYVQERHRNMQKSSMSYSDFLKDLQIKVRIHKMNDMNINRISQLTERTNQFTFSGKKYSVENLKQIDKDVYCISYTDRIGEQGIIGAAIVDENELDSFLMSCRILGRGVEDLFYFLICDKYNPSKISLEETGRNKAAQDFFPNKETSIWIEIESSEL